jgi:soluble lytic murein transglycosylase-like protein
MKNLFKLVVPLVVATAAWAADPATPGTHIVYEAVLSNGFSVRHDHQQKLGETTRLYLSADPAAGYIDVPTAEIISLEWEEVPLPAPAPAAPRASTREDLDLFVNSASDLHQVDPDLIRSVIKAESGFNVRAVSPKGAQGLMQLMPQTANQLGVKDAFAPNQNVEGGTRYLRDLLVLYNNDMVKALAAYNAGPQRVEQYHGVPPYRETHAYVARVIRDFNHTKLAARKTPGTSSKKQKSSSAAAQPHTKAAKSTPQVNP